MATNRYKLLVARIYDSAEATIKNAVSTHAESFLKGHPTVRPCIQRNSEIVKQAKALVAELSTKLTVSGTLSTTTRIQVIPPHRAVMDHSPWFLWGSIRTSPLIDITYTHEEILRCPGGAFGDLFAQRKLQVPDSDRISISHQSVIDQLFGGDLQLLSKMQWAIEQCRLLDTEFVEWTKQFYLDTPKRAIDLSYYFSPVFASFGTNSGAKVFSSRPRVENYSPMSKQLAILLTTARSAKDYSEREWYI